MERTRAACAAARGPADGRMEGKGAAHAAAVKARGGIALRRIHNLLEGHTGIRAEGEREKDAHGKFFELFSISQPVTGMSAVIHFSELKYHAIPYCSDTNEGVS